jgi:mono/diheme cytochrome c family protein
LTGTPPGRYRQRVGRLLALLLVMAVAAGLSGIALGAASPTKGKAVYAANGCGSCHAIGKKGALGPNLAKGALAADAKKRKQAPAIFVRASITKPNAFVAKGYKKGVMPATYGKSLSKQQLDNLVAYLLK